MTDGEAYLVETRAQHLQSQADWLTAFREKCALVTGPAMAVVGPSWPLALAETAGGMSDYFDGYLAKQAKGLSGRDMNPSGKDNDRDADKMFTYSGLLGTMVRDFADGKAASALFVGGVTAVSAVRDLAINRLRSSSETKESSVLVNRANTVIRIGSLALAMSPLGKTEVGRRIRNTGIAASAALAIVGYFQTKRQLEAAAA